MLTRGSRIDSLVVCVVTTPPCDNSKHSRVLTRRSGSGDESYALWSIILEAICSGSIEYVPLAIFALMSETFASL